MVAIMDETKSREHWHRVYATKPDTELSWFQDSASPSFELIERTGVTREASIVDIGGGASRLVDRLVSAGYRDLTVLDLSGVALNVAMRRLGPDGADVVWIAADVTQWLPARRYDIWHDRATFHFLTEPAARAAYVDSLHRGLNLGGFVIIGTFAPDGPERCSGLPVMRYDGASLARQLGSSFRLTHAERHTHKTPAGVEQLFQFAVLQRTVGTGTA